MRLFLPLLATISALFLMSHKANAKQYLCNHSNLDLMYAFSVKAGFAMMGHNHTVRGFFSLPAGECDEIVRGDGVSEANVVLYTTGSRSQRMRLRVIERDGRTVFGAPAPSIGNNAWSFCVTKNRSSFTDGSVNLGNLRSCSVSKELVEGQFWMLSPTDARFTPARDVPAVAVITSDKVSAMTISEYNKRF
ncbi:MAG: hypothetical protein AAFM92_12975 [Pseudomonadota bacterium]